MPASPAAEANLFRRAALLLRGAGVLPVVTVERAEQGASVAAALAEGGLGAVEITLRSPAALAAIGAAKRSVPGLLVGAGTVLDAGQLRDALDAGADFLVTPGTSPALAAALAAAPVPCVPGAATVGEILGLAELGFEAVKLFPAAALGGVAMVRALAGPLPRIGLCPTGGIAAADAPAYLAEPNVLCVGGSWMVPRSWLAEGRYDKVTAAAADAAALAAARAAA